MQVELAGHAWRVGGIGMAHMRGQVCAMSATRGRIGVNPCQV
jgi:hypothetical protein